MKPNKTEKTKVVEQSVTELGSNLRAAVLLVREGSISAKEARAMCCQPWVIERDKDPRWDVRLML